MLRSFNFIIVLSCALFVQGQENMGIANSNYSPTNSFWLNPSSIADNRAFLDIHIAGAAGFLHNNYAYLPKEKFYFPRDILSPSGLGDDVAFSTSNSKRVAYIDGAAQLLGASLSIGDHGIAVNTAVRAYTKGKNIPSQLTDLIIDGVYEDPVYGQRETYKNISVNALTWAELDFSYAYLFHKFDKDIWSGGITVKRLWGIAGAGQIFKDIDYTVLNENVVTVHDFSSTNGFTQSPGFGAGKGWAVDLGVTYKRTLQPVMNYVPHGNDCRKVDYLYKVGVSLLDYGSVKFDQDIVRTIDIEGEDHTEASSEGINTVEVLQNLTENQFDESTTGLKAKLPTAISGQFDYNVGYGLFLNGTVMFPLRLANRFAIQRTNLIAVTPRWERKRLEVALPITLVDYRYPSVGLGVRLNNIVIGTDRLIPMLMKVDVYRMDIYFNVKWTIFERKKCRDKLRPASYKTTLCPSYH